MGPSFPTLYNERFELLDKESVFQYQHCVTLARKEHQTLPVQFQSGTFPDSLQESPVFVMQIPRLSARAAHLNI